jgi:hypothetical protein
MGDFCTANSSSGKRSKVETTSMSAFRIIDYIISGTRLLLCHLHESQQITPDPTEITQSQATKSFLILPVEQCKIGVLERMW